MLLSGYFVHDLWPPHNLILCPVYCWGERWMALVALATLDFSFIEVECIEVGLCPFTKPLDVCLTVAQFYLGPVLNLTKVIWKQTMETEISACPATTHSLCDVTLIYWLNSISKRLIIFVYQEISFFTVTQPIEHKLLTRYWYNDDPPSKLTQQ